MTATLSWLYKGQKIHFIKLFRWYYTYVTAVQTQLSWLLYNVHTIIQEIFTQTVASLKTNECILLVNKWITSLREDSFKLTANQKKIYTDSQVHLFSFLHVNQNCTCIDIGQCTLWCCISSKWGFQWLWI